MPCYTRPSVNALRALFLSSAIALCSLVPSPHRLVVAFRVVAGVIVHLVPALLRPCLRSGTLETIAPEVVRRSWQEWGVTLVWNVWCRHCGWSDGCWSAVIIFRGSVPRVEASFWRFLWFNLVMCSVSICSAISVGKVDGAVGLGCNVCFCTLRLPMCEHGWVCVMSLGYSATNA